MPDDQPERWSTSQVAEFWGAANIRSIARTLGRLGIKPVAREPGRKGQNLYDAEEIRQAKAARPGKGRWRSSRGPSSPTEQ